jgi:hypothetical protein
MKVTALPGKVMTAAAVIAVAVKATLWPFAVFVVPAGVSGLAGRGDLPRGPAMFTTDGMDTWASSSVVVGHAAPIGSAWLPLAWHRGPCPCGHCALPGDAALNRAAYYRHVAAP